MWCVSHVHSLLEHTDSAVMMDDESLHSLCHRNLNIELDRFLAQLIPSVSGVVVPQFLMCLHLVILSLSKAQFRWETERAVTRL